MVAPGRPAAPGSREGKNLPTADRSRKRLSRPAVDLRSAYRHVSVQCALETCAHCTCTCSGFKFQFSDCIGRNAISPARCQASSLQFSQIVAVFSRLVRNRFFLTKVRFPRRITSPNRTRLHPSCRLRKACCVPLPTRRFWCSSCKGASCRPFADRLRPLA